MNLSKAWPPPVTCDDARRCILVVEDELLIRYMLCDGLRDEGYHVIEACNADEALIILETAIPDLLISDVQMPGSLDGLELMKAARETLTTLPVIIMSGRISPSQAKAAGASEFFAKPYSMEKVFEVVGGLMAKAK